MEINNLLREAFLTEWNRLSYKNVSPYLTMISENFEVEKVRDSINENINKSFDRNTRERYHRQNLTELAKIYAQTLYVVSNNGANLNSATFRIAKVQMKSKGSCDAYPC
jgi:ATP-dependent Lon protease